MRTNIKFFYVLVFNIIKLSCNEVQIVENISQIDQAFDITKEIVNEVQIYSGKLPNNLEISALICEGIRGKFYMCVSYILKDNRMIQVEKSLNPENDINIINKLYESQKQQILNNNNQCCTIL